MKKHSLLAFLLVATLSANLCADWYVPGDWATDAWNPNSNQMTDLGGGIHEITLTGQLANTRYEFKVLGTAGDWGSYANEPDSSNSWGFSDSAGNITIRLDENSLSNGYLKDLNRITVANDVTGWNVVGNFMNESGGGSDWNNGDAFFTMTSLGGGVYEYSATVSVAGSYEGKFVRSGSWDAIGASGRTVNASTFAFSTVAPNEVVKFTLNTNWGAGNVTAVPEPSGLAVMGAAIACLGIARRKRA